MTPEMLDLARRAVACKGWRWMPGMLAVSSTRFGEGPPFRVCYLSALNLRADPGALPDFDDAATLGCLLALVREAWGDARIFLRPTGNDMWSVSFAPWLRRASLSRGRNEVEALVAAFEASP